LNVAEKARVEVIGNIMLRLVRSLLAHFAPKEEASPTHEIDAFLASLRHASPDHLAGVLAAAMLAKKTLDTTRLVEMPFPAAHLEANAVLDAAARADLLNYVRELRRFQSICAETETALRMAVAKGLDTWIATISAVALPGMFDKAREIWRFLIQGETGMEGAYRFMVRRAPTEVELVYMTYRPTLLLSPS
jgi:hypothetical protein